MVALTINSVIGSGIFGLPSQLANVLGKNSTWAVLLAGLAIGIIIACFAEVASSFSEAGGPYLYARVAFGRFMGIETGWMLFLSQLSAPAANANLFVIYLGQFWPAASTPIPRFLILTVLIGLLAVINYRGVRSGAQVSNIFTIAKLIPLGIVIVGGAVYLLSRGSTAIAAPAQASSGAWLKAILLMFFAYGGFESALTPMSEAKDPQRDAAFGLFAALLGCIIVYSLIQLVCVNILPNATSSGRPLAEVAQIALGRSGATLVTIGALVSFYGYLSAKILGMPRVSFALAEQGDFPRIFAAVHPRFQTPYFSILVFAALTWALALFGNFAWNLTLSAVARLMYYAVSCAALPVLRRRYPGRASFRLPVGHLFAVVGVLICLALVTQVDLSKSLILIATILAALANYLLVRRTPSGVAGND
jgi:basic amino acid/polyamine antiporter, APA family